MVTEANQTTANSSVASSGVVGRLAGGLVLWLRGLHTRQELMRLSERTLEDIGTTPADISAFARQNDPWRQLPKDAVIMVALAALVERLEGWRDRRRKQAQVYRELMAYSDRELTDLGISRRDIGTIARDDTPAHA